MYHKELEKKIRALKMWEDFIIEEYPIKSYQRVPGFLLKSNYDTQQDDVKTEIKIPIPNEYFDDFEVSKGERPRINTAYEKLYI